MQTQYTAYLRKTHTYQFKMWSDPQKTRPVATIQHGMPMHLLSDKKVDGFYPVEYEGEKGWVNSRYIEVELTKQEGEAVKYKRKENYAWTLNLWEDAERSRSQGTIADEMMDMVEVGEKFSKVICNKKIGYVDNRCIEKVN